MMSLAYGAIKLSVLFSYRRLFVVNQDTRFGVVTIAAIVIIILWTIAVFFNTIFYCGVHIDVISGNLLEIFQDCPDAFTAVITFFASDLGTGVIVLSFHYQWYKCSPPLLIQASTDESRSGDSTSV
ncbi:hypothetical protein N7G274_002444 [Stereocaulon virgatum]|uniref:Rhodopsin domain-containing protein n=1 Tax=Stereocaulon virgatum TaxID=373712 RepID=A0ABR4AHL7_9LECA